MPISISVPMMLDEHHDGLMADVHVAIPAQVQSWSASTQTATVQPMVRKPLRTVDGQQDFETAPAIQNVPCYVHRGGGFLVSLPFTAGDPVFLIFSEQSYSEYLNTGKISNPTDIRRHGIGYPFAIPGPAPNSQLLQSPSTALVIGVDGGTDQVTIVQGNVTIGGSSTVTLKVGNTPVTISAGAIAAGATPQKLVTQTDMTAILAALEVFATACSSATTVTQIATAATALNTALTGPASPTYTSVFKAQ